MVVLPAPGGELTQIQGVGVTGEPAVAGQEPEQRHLLDVGQHRLVPRDSSGGNGHGWTLLAVMAGDPDHNSKRPQPVEATDATSSTRSLTRATRCR